MKHLIKRTLLAAAAAGFVGSASAGAIFSAVGGTIDAGGPGFGTLTETFNQSGLSTGYVSGVTDFDTYLAGNPTHTTGFSGFEWFSNQGTNAATVTYDLGAQKSFDAFALWNEESSGIGLLDVLVSSDGVNFSLLLDDVTPTDNPLANYGADRWNFAAVSARYVRLDMSRCPQANPGTFTACAIGEVAFREAAAVPEPGSLALVGLALAGVAGVARRRRQG